MKDSLGDRMKRAESSWDFQLIPRLPIIIRVDGRAFHTLLRKAPKPFCGEFTRCMQVAACETARSIDGFKLGYVQSDEASFLLTDTDNLETQQWFGGRLSKIITIAASTMTAYFNGVALSPGQKPAVFDGRAFQLPIEDVPNYFLWRTRDWSRNSLFMFARTIFSHKQLHGKNQTEVHEMLHGEGRNWATEVSPQLKNGTFIERGPEGDLIVNHEVGKTYLDIRNIVERALTPPSPVVECGDKCSSLQCPVTK